MYFNYIFIEYVGKGKAEIKCTETGSWDLEDVTCELAHCNELPVISHARIQYSAPIGQTSEEQYSVGTKVNLYL